MTRNTVRILPLVIAGLLILARPALAGPPLLCHPFDIGTAKSLPWDGRDAWWQGHSDYRLVNLVADTEALLGPATPVIVRMETLRRAALYASTDPAIARSLMTTLAERAKKAESAATGAKTLALFDAGYLAATFQQITQLAGESQFRDRARAVAVAAAAVDGIALVNRSIALTPDDPGLRFGAALVVAGTDRAAYRRHADKARAGAPRDALLARNVRQLAVSNP
jgi:hypothetical protein